MPGISAGSGRSPLRWASGRGWPQRLGWRLLSPPFRVRPRQRPHRVHRRRGLRRRRNTTAPSGLSSSSTDAATSATGRAGPVGFRAVGGVGIDRDAHRIADQPGDINIGLGTSCDAFSRGRSGAGHRRRPNQLEDIRGCRCRGTRKARVNPFFGGGHTDGSTPAIAETSGYDAPAATQPVKGSKASAADVTPRRPAPGRPGRAGRPGTTPALRPRRRHPPRMWPTSKVDANRSSLTRCCHRRQRPRRLRRPPPLPRIPRIPRRRVSHRCCGDGAAPGRVHGHHPDPCRSRVGHCVDPG